MDNLIEFDRLKDELKRLSQGIPTMRGIPQPIIRDFIMDDSGIVKQETRVYCETKEESLHRIVLQIEGLLNTAPKKYLLYYMKPFLDAMQHMASGGTAYLGKNEYSMSKDQRIHALIYNEETGDYDIDRDYIFWVSEQVSRDWKYNK